MQVTLEVLHDMAADDVKGDNSVNISEEISRHIKNEHEIDR